MQFIEISGKDIREKPIEEIKADVKKKLVDYREIEKSIAEIDDEIDDLKMQKLELERKLRKVNKFEK